MKPLQIGLLGIGTVGRGTFEVLTRNQEEIQRRAGRGIQISMVADLDADRARTIVGSRAEVVTDARQVIANPEIDIVIEREDPTEPEVEEITQTIEPTDTSQMET